MTTITRVTEIAMCPPTYFSVDYVINPWMSGNVGALDLARAADQWSRLRDRLATHVKVRTIDPQPGLPDMVFTANAGMSIGQDAVASHFVPKERRGEEVHFKDWYRDNGFELYPLPDEVGFEGQGDCLLHSSGEWLWTSAGPRTESTAYRHLSRCFNLEVVTMRLVDPRFYHIDTCLTVLNDGYVMYFPDAFDQPSIDKIEARIPPDRQIRVSEEDAALFACNAVNLGSDIYLHALTPELRARLEGAGFDVHEHDLSEFLKAGGSAKCLTLLLYGLGEG